MTLFHSDQFLRAISNTLVISFYSLILAAPVPILLALMINEVHSKGPQDRADGAVPAALHLGGDRCRVS